jgi:hypothetical protein
MLARHRVQVVFYGGERGGVEGSFSLFRILRHEK